MSEIYIRVGKNNVVEFIHRSPFDPANGLQSTRDELEKTGVFIDTIPNPDMIEGKRAIPKYNPDNKSVYYDYVDIPLSLTERVEQLENAFNELLMFGDFGLGGED